MKARDLLWPAAMVCLVALTLAPLLSSADPAGTPRSRSFSIPASQTFTFDGGAVSPSSVTTPFVDAGCSIIGGVSVCNGGVTSLDGGTATFVTLIITAGTGVTGIQLSNGPLCFGGSCTGGNIVPGVGVAVRSNGTTIGSWNTGTGDYVHPIGFINNTDASSSGGYRLASKLLCTGVAPTISSGFGGASVTANTGHCSFSINVGSDGGSSSGVIGLPTAANGWACNCSDVTTSSATVFITKQTASTTASCTVGNFNTSGAAAAWAANDVLECSAKPN